LAVIAIEVSLQLTGLPELLIARSDPITSIYVRVASSSWHTGATSINQDLGPDMMDVDFDEPVRLSNDSYCDAHHRVSLQPLPGFALGTRPASQTEHNGMRLHGQVYSLLGTYE